MAKVWLSEEGQGHGVRNYVYVDETRVCISRQAASWLRVRGIGDRMKIDGEWVGDSRELPALDLTDAPKMPKIARTLLGRPVGQ
jgi:hypothetical protein